MRALEWIRYKYQQFLKRRQTAREIHPDSFRHLAQELLELARVAQHLWPQEKDFAERIKSIQQEMEQLDDLASRPEFKRLSPEKRIKLRMSLIKSRDQLIETVKTAPSPTATLQ